MNNPADEQQIDVRQIEANIRLKLAQIQLTSAEEMLTIKKVRWYECVLIGGAGITSDSRWPKSLWLEVNRFGV